MKFKKTDVKEVPTGNSLRAKPVVSFTLDKDLAKQFKDRHPKENRSLIIEGFLKRYLKR